LVLPLDCFAEGRLRFVADTERDLSETVVVLAAPLPEFYRLVSSFKFGDDETEVVQACGKYLALMRKLVESFVARFGESDRQLGAARREVLPPALATRG